MRPGTPGFNGDRLREAREARGLSGTALAELLGLPRQSVNAYEQKRATPHPECARLIAEKLNLPAAFFFENYEFEDDRPIYWRSMAAATKTARLRSRRKYDWLRRIVRYLSDFVDFPSVKLPAAVIKDDPAAISEGEIEDAAQRTRAFFGLGNGAIENVTWLLENHGVIIGFSQFGAATLDAFSQVCADGRAYAMVNFDHGTAVRYRFDLAHELGHLVLHRNLDGRHFLSTSRNSLMEKQAHHFASEFLMPSRAFAKSFYGASVDGLKVTKRMWGVSMQASLVHAQRLGLVTAVQSQKLWRGISARGWRRSEPYDDTIPAERPELLRSAFSTVLSTGTVTREMVLDALPYTDAEIEHLCGLDPGTLSEEKTLRPVPTISPSRSQPPRADRMGAGGDVLHFSHTGRRDRE